MAQFSRAYRASSCPLSEVFLPRRSMVVEAEVDPKRPIREADIRRCWSTVRSWRQSTSFHAEMRRKPKSCRGSNVSDYRNERQGIHAQISWGELAQVLA